MQPAPETQDQDFLGTSRVIPAPSLAHEPKAEFLLCSLQFGLQGCLLSFLNGHLSPDQSHEVVLYLAVNTTYVCSFSRLKNRLANNSYECLKEGKVLSNDDFCLLSSFPCFICKVFFSLVLSGLFTFLQRYTTTTCCVCILFWCIHFNLGKNHNNCCSSFLKASSVSRLYIKLAGHLL